VDQRFLFNKFLQIVKLRGSLERGQVYT